LTQQAKSEFQKENNFMRSGGRILMIFGLVLAVIAGAATFVIIQQSGVTEEAPPEVEMVEVVVAVQPLPPWQEIPVDALQIREYPAPAPENAVKGKVKVENEEGELEEISGIDYLRDKISNTRIYPGQIIVETQLIDKELEEQRLGLGSNASFIVPDGKVAVIIPVDSISTIGGALRAGDQVDIIATMEVEFPQEPERESETYTQFLLQKVQILRIGAWSAGGDEEDKGGGGGNFVTVIVEPQQALELKHTRKSTAFEFVLRSITDDSDFVTEAVNDDYIIEQYNILP
jgi:Flp pilus assembly protein CpaB